MRGVGNRWSDGRGGLGSTPWSIGTLIVSVLALGMVSGCEVDTAASRDAFRRSGDEPIRVVATVGMVGDTVRAVGGEHVMVQQLLGSGVDPHLYKASRDDVRDILRADMVFYSGLLLEGKMVDTLRKVSRTRPVFAVTDGISRQDLLGEGEGTDHFDPHVWMDLALWTHCVDEVARCLGEYDPVHADEYRLNAEAYREQLLALDAYARGAMASIPESRRVFLTSHDAFQYFGRAYGIEVMGIQGISTESEAGLRHVNELVDLLVDRQVPAVFFESSVPQRSIEALVAGVASRGHRVAMKGPLYSDAMGPAGTYEGTYLGMIDHNVTLVARSLGGEAPVGGWQGKLTGNAVETP